MHGMIHTGTQLLVIARGIQMVSKIIAIQRTCPDWSFKISSVYIAVGTYVCVYPVGGMSHDHRILVQQGCGYLFSRGEKVRNYIVHTNSATR